MFYEDLDDDTKSSILEYSVSVEYIVENNDALVCDMFAGLNSNNYVLNNQEVRNAAYWGEFKVLVYSVASEYRDFFLTYNILSDKNCQSL